jgi:hypothetical protein
MRFQDELAQRDVVEEPMQLTSAEAEPFLQGALERQRARKDSARKPRATGKWISSRNNAKSHFKLR